MERIAQFERVSRERFAEDLCGCFPSMSKEEVEQAYDLLKLPKRATGGSAGYDFYSPVPFSLAPGETVTIPTGIRAKMEDGYVLLLFPRSGLGFKYRLQLNNTVGVIDSDYYGSDNEGHIFCRITNDTNTGKTVEIQAGEGFCQGIFLAFGITVDDESTETRNGGFGSTGKGA